MKAAGQFAVVGLGVVLITAGLSLDASGQETTGIDAGTLAAVRVSRHLDIRSDSREWLVGTLVDLTADSLYLSVRNEERARAWLRGDVDRFRVSCGLRGHAVRGAIVGALVGIPVGIGIATLMPKPTGWLEFVSSEQVTGFLGGWAASTLLGSAIGGAAKTPCWQDVDLRTVPSLRDSTRAAEPDL